MLDLDEASLLHPRVCIIYLQSAVDDVIGDRTTFTSTSVFRFVHPPYLVPLAFVVKRVGDGREAVAFLCEPILCL